ncbi:MAG: hypothetical protein PVJ15_06400, partial [Gammaproteobacteria bacterium]
WNVTRSGRVNTNHFLREVEVPGDGILTPASYLPGPLGKGACRNDAKKSPRSRERAGGDITELAN